MKSNVYSWRLSSELKTELERAARLRRAPVSEVLEQAVRDWLAQNVAELADDEKNQRELRAAAGRCFGTIKGLGAYHAGRGREIVRQGLRGRKGSACYRLSDHSLRKKGSFRPNESAGLDMSRIEK